LLFGLTTGQLFDAMYVVGGDLKSAEKAAAVASTPVVPNADILGNEQSTAAAIFDSLFWSVMEGSSQEQADMSGAQIVIEEEDVRPKTGSSMLSMPVPSVPSTAGLAMDITNDLLSEEINRISVLPERTSPKEKGQGQSDKPDQPRSESAKTTAATTSPAAGTKTSISEQHEDRREPSIHDLRDRLHDKLFEALDEGRLEEVVSEALAGRPPQHANQGPATPPECVKVEVPTPSAPSKRDALERLDIQGALEVYTSTTDLGLVHVLDTISARDRRIGELTAMIREAERKIAERDLTCQQIQDRISTAKLDLAHVDLDFQWHSQALQGAQERNVELDTCHRRLRCELDGHRQKMKHAFIETDTLLMTARSDWSTATGGTFPCQSLPNYTPRTLVGPLSRR